MPKKPTEDNLFLFDPSEFRAAAPLPAVKEVFKPKPITEERIAALERMQVMFSLLLDMDMNKDIVSILLSMDDALTLEQYRYLAGPVVVHGNGWSSMLEEASLRWLHKAIYKERLEIVIRELKTGESEGLASNAEIVAAMHPATLEAPLHHDWQQVYLWASNAALCRHKPEILQRQDGTTYKDMWEVIGEKYPPTFDRIQQDYTHLAQDIRQRVVKHAAAQGIALQSKKERAQQTAEATIELPLFEEAI